MPSIGSVICEIDFDIKDILEKKDLFCMVKPLPHKVLKMLLVEMYSRQKVFGQLQI